ncbi:MAG: AbgT family transporter [Bacteroidales bacterium]|nr:AbgT family transporter [Bacteroidales bacterium]
MKFKQNSLHPVTLYFIIGVLIVIASWICSLYGLAAIHPETGEIVRVQNLLNPEGIRWFLRNVIANFTGFAPLGMVLVAMIGIGVAQHSGLIDASLRRVLKNRQPRRGVMLCLILLGILSNVIGDSGYILLIPLSTVLFVAVGLHPIAGIIMTYVSVTCGYSANFMLSTMDPLIARITQTAAETSGVATQHIGPLCNSFFMAISVIPLTLIIYWLTKKWLFPKFKNDEHPIKEYKPLNHREKRALALSLVVGGLYFFGILWSTFSSYGILRGVSGSLIRSPFIMGILFIISLGITLMGITYGLGVGVYRKDKEVINGLTQSFQWMGNFLLIVFFASQMFAVFSYSNLDRLLIINGSSVFNSIQAGPLLSLLLFILFSAVMNLFMVSAMEKWSIFSFLFIPFFASLGVTPEILQTAYRIGDSSTNALTPFMFYLPLILAYVQRYDDRAGYATILRCVWPYSLAILLVWTLLFILWYVLGLPFGW